METTLCCFLYLVPNHELLSLIIKAVSRLQGAGSFRAAKRLPGRNAESFSSQQPLPGVQYLPFRAGAGLLLPGEQPQYNRYDEHYSYLNATIGSTRAARRAGM